MGVFLTSSCGIQSYTKLLQRNLSYELPIQDLAKEELNLPIWGGIPN